MSAHVVEWIAFRGTNPRGERRRGSLEAFVDLLTSPHPAPSKHMADGFSATRYYASYTASTYSEVSKRQVQFRVDAPAAYRNAAAVEAISAVVLDVDELPEFTRIAATGNFVVAYTTWSHRPEAPRWRVVILLARAVEAEAWPVSFAAAVERFAPNADHGCKDVSHLYWLGGGTRQTVHLFEAKVFDGELWSPSGMPTVDLPPSRSSAVPPPRRDDPATTEEQSAARRMLAASCRKLAQHGIGGRQVALYGHARHLGHLVAANAIDQDEADAALWHAISTGAGNGVGDERECECRRALERGLAKGIADGAFDFEADARAHMERARLRPGASSKGVVSL